MNLKEARKNPQKFLDNLDTSGTYIKQFVYNPNQEMVYDFFSEEKKGIIADVSITGIGRKRGIVHVYPRAFSEEPHENIDDLMSSLIDHEGFHTKQGRYFIKNLINSLKGNNNYGFPEVEMPAVANQIANFEKRNISDSFKQYVMNTYERQNASYKVIKKGLFYKLEKR